MLRPTLCAGMALALAAPAFAADQTTTPAPTSDQRLRNVEQRLDKIESGATPASAPPSFEPSAAGGAHQTSNAFNPAVSLILNGTYASFSKNPSTYALPGFALGS